MSTDRQSVRRREGTPTGQGATRPGGSPRASTAERLLRLQRAAGNRAVVHAIIQRDDEDDSPSTVSSSPEGTQGSDQGRVSLAFVLGRTGDRYLDLAAEYYAARLGDAQIIRDAPNLRAVFEHLRGLDEGIRIDDLYLITHASPEGDMLVPMHPGDDDNRVTYPELRAALRESPDWFELSGQVDERTQIRVRGCSLGRSRRMTELLDEAFGAVGTVIAPTHKQAYGRLQSGGIMETFAAYFVEHPGWPPRWNRRELMDRFRDRYPHAPEAVWEPMMHLIRPRRYQQSWVVRQLPSSAAVARREARRTWLQGDSAEGWRIRNVTIVPWFPLRPETWYYLDVQDPADPSRRETRRIDVAVPTDEEALATVAAESSRPDAFEWTVTRPTRGGMQQVRVTGQRTEYRAPVGRLPVIASPGSVEAPETDEQYYTVSTVTPDEVPAAAGTSR